MVGGVMADRERPLEAQKPLRGCSWINDFVHLRTGYRMWDHPVLEDRVIGFRMYKKTPKIRRRVSGV